MRVISGKYKSRRLEGAKLTKTRTTMDKVKTSLFDMIQAYLEDALVLDLFSGSGSLGIEALSRGAKFSYFNDSNPEAVKIIKKNLENLKIDNGLVFNLDYLVLLKKLKQKKLIFDIVLLDPPYLEDYLDLALENLDNIINEKSIIVCETTKNHLINNHNYLLIKEKVFSNKKISILRKR